jgi:hypothetical protein
LATIIILTGVGAPLSLIFWAIGTMPFSFAMKRKAAWQFPDEWKVEEGQRPRVVTDATPEEVLPIGVRPF